MPIYEYQCGACGQEVEILQKLSDAPARKCPECGKLKLSRNISAAGFRLSGTGWYETDFKNKGQKNLAGEGESSSKSMSSSSDSSDSKSKSSEKKSSNKSSGEGKSSGGGSSQSAA